MPRRAGLNPSQAAGGILESLRPAVRGVNEVRVCDPEVTGKFVQGFTPDELAWRHIQLAILCIKLGDCCTTSAGEHFYEEAKDILARVDVAVRRIKTRPPGEKLRIGYVHSLTAGIMPRVVERLQSYNKDVFLELSDLTTETMWQRAAAEQIDIAILPKSLEARFKGFQWVELQRLAPVLVISKKNPLAKLTRIHPEKLRDKRLLGLGADKYPEYVPRLKAILKPFGVKPQLRNHTSEDIAAHRTRDLASRSPCRWCR